MKNIFTKSKSIDITLDQNKDNIEIADDCINITTEKGVRIELPYEKAIIETKSKRISFKKDGEGVSIKKKK